MKQLNAPEQDFDLFCDCCGNGPLPVAFRHVDENNVSILLCFNSHMKELESVNE